MRTLLGLILTIFLEACADGIGASIARITS